MGAKWCGLAYPLFGGAEKAAGLKRSDHRMPVATPPIEAPEQFLGAKSQPREFVSTLGRGVTADPIAVDDINLATIETRGSFRVHLSVREADCTGDVARDVRITGASVDHGDSSKGGLEIDG